MAPKKKQTTIPMRSAKGGLFQKQQQQNKSKGKVAAAAAVPPRGLGGAAAPSAAASTATAAAASAPPVDPAAAAAAEETLRAFDLNGKFGPCVNPTRLERWERAERLGLNPPKEVKALLEKFAAVHGKKTGVSDKSLWHGRV